MSGLFTSVHIDLGDVDKGLDAMARRSVLHAALLDIKLPMRTDQKEHAKAKTGPEGSWAPRAASTMAARAKARKSGRKFPSRLLGRLPTAVSYRVTANAVIAESRIGFSEIHQDGGTAGKGARIPARPFLWISDQLMHTAEDVVTSKLLAAYGGP